MKQQLGRLKSIFRTIILIMRNKDVRLLFYLSSIDHDYLAASRKLKKSSWEGSLHPLFDPEYYRFHYLDPSFCGNAYVHFLSSGFKRNYRPGPFFDYAVYQRSTGWHSGLGNPLKHYLLEAKQWARTGMFFDGDWYRDKTPALWKSEIDPVRHYRLYGCLEEKSPIPHFDPRFYRKFSEASPVPDDALSHYLTYGLDNDTFPGPFFDPNYYRRRYGSELGNASPLEHYLRKGVHQGKYIAEKVERLKSKPNISIIVPVFNPDPALLNNCIRSVLFQQYPHWQLCLADDGSSREGTRELLDYWSGLDKRISVVFLERNGGISVATNSAAALADGEYLGFLDNDDELSPDCLYHIAQAIVDELPDIIYTDEDLIGNDGRRFSAFRKADFNRVLLYSHNYITHFVVVSKTIFAACKGLHSRYDGAQDFDFMLRASEHAGVISHIPRVLYHWRATQTSTSINHDQKGYAHGAGKQALQSCFERSGIAVSVQDGDINYSYRIKKQLGSQPSISVLIWGESRDCDTLGLQRLKAETRYDNCDFIFLNTTAQRQELEAGGRLAKLPGERVYLAGIEPEETKARGFARAVSLSESDYLVFLDSSVVSVDSDWLNELVSQMMLHRAGCVCGRVSYPGGDGISYTLPDVDSASADYYQRFLTCCSRHLNGLHHQQQIRFAPWDVCILRRSEYERLGGFDYQRYPTLFAMTDFALRLSDEGLGTYYTPYSVVFCNGLADEQTEAEAKVGREEKKRFQQTWKKLLSQGDPYYNLGVLDDSNIDREGFAAWFTGGELIKESLDLRT